MKAAHFVIRQGGDVTMVRLGNETNDGHISRFMKVQLWPEFSISKMLAFERTDLNF